MKLLSDFPPFTKPTPQWEIEVWYWKSEFATDLLFGIIPPEFDPNNLDKTHILLGTVGNPEGNSKEDFYIDLQGELWSPNGEANDLIENKSLGHTSMSSGDILVFRRERWKSTNNVWMVKNVGWQRMNKGF